MPESSFVTLPFESRLTALPPRCMYVASKVPLTFGANFDVVWKLKIDLSASQLRSTSRAPNLRPSEGKRQQTLTNPQTNSAGNPYLNTVSTNTLNASACTQHIAASPNPVRPNRSPSPHNFLSSPSSLLNSRSSSSLPPSLYRKSRGVHRFSLHLARNSELCFLKVVTA